MHPSRSASIKSEKNFWEEFCEYLILSRIIPSLTEAKAEKIAELKTAVLDLYASILWYVEMKRMGGEEVPLTVREKIRQIKAKYDPLKAKINGFKMIVDILSYPLPHATISQVREELESIEKKSVLSAFR